MGKKPKPPKTPDETNCGFFKAIKQNEAGDGPPRPCTFTRAEKQGTLVLKANTGSPVTLGERDIKGRCASG